MKKKEYQQPQTQSLAMEPRAILCASPGGGFIDPNVGYGGAGGGMVGG